MNIRYYREQHSIEETVLEGQSDDYFTFDCLQRRRTVVHLDIFEEVVCSRVAWYHQSIIARMLLNCYSIAISVHGLDLLYKRLNTLDVIIPREERCCGLEIKSFLARVYIYIPRYVAME